MTDPRPLTVDLGDYALRLWDHQGPQGRPTVLFVHGYLDTGRSFDEVCRLLGDEVRALCLDWRGHGQSAAVGSQGYHLVDHLKDLGRVLDWLGRRGDGALAAPVHIDALAGHSMGGNVSLLLAGARPERVPRLLLLDSLGPPSEPPEEQPERLGRLLDQLGPPRPFKVFASFEEAVERVMATNGGLSRLGAERMTRHALRDASGGVTFAFDPALKGPVPYRFPESFFVTLCSRMDMPVRVLRAQNGYVPEGEPASTRLAAMKHAGLETVAEVGHHLHVEVPERVAEAVRSLLRIPARQITASAPDS